jgi:hypothetical protein
MNPTDEDRCNPSDEPTITTDNALVVIAHELRAIRKTMHRATFDPNCETVGDRIHTELHDNLQVFEGKKTTSVADLLLRIARALEEP